MARRMHQHAGEPKYPEQNYYDAALIMERMRRNRRFLTPQQRHDIRDQALSGDLDGASKRLGELLAVRWA